MGELLREADRGVDARSKRRLASGWTRVIAAVLAVALLAGTGLVIHAEQSQSLAAIVARFNLRAEIGARFLESYVAEILNREVQAAVASTSQRAFVDVTTTMGFQAATLTDATGHALRVFPNNRALIGTDLSVRYPLISEAMAGHVAVSGVQQDGLVPGAVWLAVPFPSGGGLRIYSGALAISTEGMISPFMRTLAPIKGTEVWLIDSTGETVAGSSTLSQRSDFMKQEDPGLLTAVQGASQGVYEGPLGRSRFTVVEVGGTPWRLVVASPESQLFIGVGGLSTAIPWLIFASLILAAATVAILQVKLTRVRAQQLDDVGLLSLTDHLSSLYNRRGYEVLATQVLKDAGREGRSAALMFFDINDLKGINDTLGHAVGDEAIIAAAALLRATFRDSDVIARLGGDEFCVVGVLPGLPGDGSAPLARLHEALARFNELDSAPFHLSLSGGLAVWEPDAPRSLDALEEEADRRMYADKQSERIAR